MIVMNGYDWRRLIGAVQSVSESGTIDVSREDFGMVVSNRNNRVLLYWAPYDDGRPFWEDPYPVPSPRPVRGFRTHWVGGLRLPWLLERLVQRLREQGVDADPNWLVFASQWEIDGFHLGNPVRSLARDNQTNSRVGIPVAPDTEVLEEFLPCGARNHHVIIWPVQRDQLDPRIPKWVSGRVCTVRPEGYGELDGLRAAPLVGVVSPWGIVYGATWLPANDPTRLLLRKEQNGPDLQFDLPALPDGQCWLVAVYLR